MGLQLQGAKRGKYEAGFKRDGNTMSAMFETNGTMTQNEAGIKIFSLPA